MYRHIHDTCGYGEASSSSDDSGVSFAEQTMEIRSLCSDDSGVSFAEQEMESEHMAKDKNRSPLFGAEENAFIDGSDVYLTKEVAGISESYETEMLQVAQQIITDNDISRLKLLVAHVYGSDSTKKCHLNILYIAAAMGSTTICKYLLDQEFTSNTLSLHRSIFKVLPENKNKSSRVSPLALSMYYGRLDNARLLLKYTSDCFLQQCHGLSSDAEELLLKELSKRLTDKHRNLQPTVVAGYEDGSPVLVVYSEELRNDVQHFCGHKVIFKNPRNIKRERSESSECHSEMLSGISEKEMKIAQQIINERSDSLWKAHSNLNIISMSSTKYVKGQKQTGAVCISLYCTSKGIIPLGEPAFPSKLSAVNGNDELLVDVREGYFEFCPGYVTSGSSTYHPKLKMGCSISRETHPINGGGTLGPFVDINGDIGFLTCAHVLFDLQGTGHFETDTASTNDVVQPAVGSLNINQPESVAFREAIKAPCGYVRRAVFKPASDVGIDAALIQITDANRIPTEGHFAIQKQFNYKAIGFDYPPAFNSGISIRPENISVTRQVMKAGSETHLTRGLISAIGIQVRPLNTVIGLSYTQKKWPMTGQIEIESLTQHIFFQPGDSGSAVFTVNEDRSLECIGMAIGFTSNFAAVVTPIVPILEALGPGVTLKAFPTSNVA